MSSQALQSSAGSSQGGACSVSRARGPKFKNMATPAKSWSEGKASVLLYLYSPHAFSGLHRDMAVLSVSCWAPVLPVT